MVRLVFHRFQKHICSISAQNVRQLKPMSKLAYFLLLLLTPLPPPAAVEASELDFFIDGLRVALSPRSLRSALSNVNKCSKSLLNLSLEPSRDAKLSTPRLIEAYGYPVEVHRVTSPDGYGLTLFRIPFGRHDRKSPWNFPQNVTNRPVAYVQHGLMATSSDWLMNPEHKSLPYILANAGYDVWLGNARGTKYSNKHVHWTVDDLEYWKFTWHEMGELDIPTVIDYVLGVTKEPKLYYIGHSMGTTMFWVAMSMRPEYNAKIRLMTAMAPVAFLGNMVSPLGLMAPLAEEEEVFFDRFGGGQFIPEAGTRYIHKFGPLLCGPSPVAMAVCGNFFFLIAGVDPCQFNTTEQISNIVGHTPDAVSSRTVLHYLQLKRSNRFAQYDHGGRHEPRAYDLSKITAKVAAFWSQNDFLAVPQDVDRLVRRLPNVIRYKRVNFDLWSHLDFTYGMDVNPLLYDHVLKAMAANYN